MGLVIATPWHGSSGKILPQSLLWCFPEKPSLLKIIMIDTKKVSRGNSLKTDLE
jgi:hypothetical protein